MIAFAYFSYHLPTFLPSFLLPFFLLPSFLPSIFPSLLILFYHDSSRSLPFFSLWTLKDAIASVSKKIRGDGNDGTQPIHASILSKINLNNNQKAGLSFAPRHHSKVSTANIDFFAYTKLHWYYNDHTLYLGWFTDWQINIVILSHSIAWHTIA